MQVCASATNGNKANNSFIIVLLQANCATDTLWISPLRMMTFKGAAHRSSMCLIHGMCCAADAIFPKQLAKSPLPPVAPVPGVRRRTSAHMLVAAPSCALEIPKEPEEAEIWECVRHALANL